ncbi:MAG: M23 family metallopeptidase [Gammaproteobacteria bacterium]
MTVLNRYRSVIQWLTLGLTMSASVVFGSPKLIDLSSIDSIPDNLPAISQGGVLVLRLPPHAQAWFNDKSLFIDDGMAVIALHRDSRFAKLRIVLDSVSKTIEFPVVTRNYKIERVDGLPPAKVTPPMDPKIRQRIKNEAATIRAARQRLDSRLDFMSDFIWPVNGRISGVYGSQRILNGTPKTPHYGVDVAVPTGTEIVAPAAGVVTYVNDDMYYSGGTLVLDHGHGLSSAFLHLSKIDVAVGDVIQQGQTIARVGATGRATGPHLDWRMNWGTRVRVDPQLLVPPMQHENH